MLWGNGAEAIEMIINKELGLTTTRAPWQGSYVVDVLTDLVEEAVCDQRTRRRAISATCSSSW
jgi:methylmalonyl-CoA mutase N-terminal domain/subunit